MCQKFSHIFLGPAASVYLKTEAAESHETSVNLYKITQHHIPEDSNLQFSPIFDIFPANETLYPQKQSTYQTYGFPAAVCHRTTDSYSHLTQHTLIELTVII